MKKIGIIIIVVLVLFAVIVAGRNIIIKHAVVAGVRAVTGLELNIGNMDLGVFKTLINIKELRLYNPPEFSDRLMLDMPEIYVDYHLGALLKKRVHLEEIRLNLKEFVVVKDEKGRLNLDALRIVQAKKEKKPPARKKEKAGLPEFQIDVLQLKVGKVVYKDYSGGSPPEVREFNLNLDKRYENITDINTFASLIIVEALKDTIIGSLADFDLGVLNQALTDSLKGVTTQAAEGTKKAMEAVQDLGDETVEIVEGAFKGAAEGIKKILPFGE